MQKMANKAWGKHRAFEIAFGRKMIKIIDANYKKPKAVNEI